MTVKARPPIAIAKPEIDAEDVQAVAASMQSGWLTQGPRVAEFEQRFAQIHQVDHALATTSCTTALHLILAGMGIGPGDEVIVPSFTWVATANAVLYCGAKPVLADIELDSMNLDPLSLKKHITSRTKAAIVVHLFGRCADMDALNQISNGLPLIEDAACAVQSSYKQRRAGSIGLAGAFSFHPRKVITTGEGGMVTTNDDALARKIRMLRNHGAAIPEESRHAGNQPFLLPEFPVMGFNFRMTDMQGALGCTQLNKLSGLIEERQKYAAHYMKELAHLDWLHLPHMPEDYTTNWQSFVCRVDRKKTKDVSRDALMQKLHDAGISSRPGTHAIHTLEFYRKTYSYAPDDFPNSLMCAQDTIALPLHSHMQPEDYNFVISELKKV